jgi:hypothetical protein
LGLNNIYHKTSTIHIKNPLNPLGPNSGEYPDPVLKSAMARQDRQSRLGADLRMFVPPSEFDEEKQICWEGSQTSVFIL